MSSCSSHSYTLDDFDYDIPQDLIAQIPLQDRSQARLLISDKNNLIHHDYIYNIGKYLPKDSLIVVNNSKVIHSRMFGNLPSGGKVEVFLLENIGNDKDKNIWSAIGKPTRKFKKGTTIIFENNLLGTIEEECTDKTTVSPFKISFNLIEPEFKIWLEKNGRVPLPPYIVRKVLNNELDDIDKISYQTVYAKNEGSVAAPTAGLHFTEELIKNLEKNDIRFSYITLHVGAGTFLPVTTQDIDKHVMHSERYIVPKETLDNLMDFKQRKRPIIFVGTTTFRCLESFRILSNNDIDSMYRNVDTLQRTSLFIRPKNNLDIYHPYFNTALMTNFHQPKSTLLMLVSACKGLDNIKNIYKEAISKKYRFFSYGDACLLWL